MALFAYEITKDNPGAYTFMKEACILDFDKANKGFDRMRENGIVGPRLWILWKDCCGLDTEFALRVITDDSIESIKYHLNKADEIIENRGIPYGEG